MASPQRIDADRFRREQFRFFTPSPTRWGDCDRFGHVNNVQFVRYFESGRLDYFHRVLDLDTVPDAVDSLIIADIHVNFLRQINHPCALEVGTRVSRLGNSSFDFEAAIFAQGEDLLYSSATSTCVWFNFRDNHSTAIPPDARQTIIHFEGLKI
jgi:acyl-CoA thioester hydrolase